MLKSKREYDETIQALHILRTETLPAEERRLQSQGLGAQKVQNLLGLTRAHIRRLEIEAETYRRITDGDLSMFDGTEDFGRLLIAARLAVHLSQRELAARLGVHESQISRDERNEYAGITVERWRQICNALGVDIVTRARLEQAVSRSVVPADEIREAAASQAAVPRQPTFSSAPAVLRKKLQPALEFVEQFVPFASQGTGPTAPTGPTGSLIIMAA